MPEKTYYEISWGSLWKLLALIAFGWIAYLALDVLLAILVALVIAAGLDAPVSWLKRKGIPRILSTLFLFVTGLVFITAIVYTIVPLAINDFTQLFSNIKDFGSPLIDSFQASDALGALTSSLNEWADALISGSIPLTQIISSLFGNVFLAITVLILAFYLTVGQDGIERFLIAILPSSHENTAISLYLKTRKKIGQWMKGQVLLSLVIGFTTFLGLWLLGVKYALLLGLIAGIFELIPFVGPIFSGGIAVLVALSVSLTLALYTLILFVFIQQLENNVLIPVVMRYTTNLNPVVILISILIGGKVFGFMGLILAIPISVFIQEIVEKWAVSKKQRRGLGL